MKVAPPNFGYVEEAIFRCGWPEPRHYGFMDSLNLRTCVVLTERPEEGFMRWMEEHGVRVLCPLVSRPAPPLMRAGPRVSLDATTPLTAPLYASQQQHQQPGRQPVTHTTGEAAEQGVVPGLGGVASGAERECTTGMAQTSQLSHTEVGVELAAGMFSTGGSHTLAPMASSAAVATSAFYSGCPPSSSAPAATLAPDATVVTPPPPRLSNAMRFLKDNFTGYSAATATNAPVYLPGAAVPVNYLLDPSTPLLPTRLSFNTAIAGDGYAVFGAGAAPLSPVTLSEPVVVNILRILLDPQYYPLLIVGTKGRYRTGVVCGCLRKLQRWNLVSILEEYRRYTGDKGRADNEEFIELFDKDLVSLELDGGRRPTVLYNM